MWNWLIWVNFGGKLDCLASKLLCFSSFLWLQLFGLMAQPPFYIESPWIILDFAVLFSAEVGELNRDWVRVMVHEERQRWRVSPLYTCQRILPPYSSRQSSGFLWLGRFGYAKTMILLLKSYRNIGLFRPDSTKSNYILNKKIVITLPCYLCHGWRVRVDLHNRGTVLLKCHLWVTFSRDSHKMANPWRRGLLCPCLHWWLMWCYVGKITTMFHHQCQRLQ